MGSCLSTDTYTCHKCGLQIPHGDRSIHESMCGNMKDFSSPALNQGSHGHNLHLQDVGQVGKKRER